MQKITLIKTLDKLKELSGYLNDKDFVAFDIETTGLDYNTSEIIGIAVCADEEEAFYVVLSYWDVSAQKLIYLETNESIVEFLSNLTSKKLIMHNGIFDSAMVYARYKVRLIDSLFHDTMLSGHLLDENSKVGLKERAASIFGEDSKVEQIKMRESVVANGGKLTKKQYELYKADADLIGYYGAKDTILTLKLFFRDVPLLFDEGLDKFFYEDEVMPLFRGPTYELNTVGLKIDKNKLLHLKAYLESECAQLKSFIETEILTYVKDKYPGTGKTNKFNIGSSKQLSWLLHEKLGNEFKYLTPEGRDLCNFLGIKLPYAPAAKRQFIFDIKQRKGELWGVEGWNPKTRKKTKPKKIGDPWNYLSCGKESLEAVKHKYKWVEALLNYAKSLKLLKTYVEGILSREQYNIIQPSFKQAGTTSGRYSSADPNFQNLPRKDKRIKSCIISRPEKVFVGADYSQLEPRVFASFSKDERLLKCFADGDDFYSVIGIEVFDKYDCSLKKDDPNSLAIKYPELRNISKTIALSATYGTTANKMAPLLKKPIDIAQEIIDNYFLKFPKVKQLMDFTHDVAKRDGKVFNLFGRPRRIPYAQTIKESYGNTQHSDLPYIARTALNLAINHTIQSTAASIMNRAAINCYKKARQNETKNVLWKQVHIVLQVHDELVLEGPKELEADMISLLKDSMENTVTIPGVQLLAEPKAADNLADLKGE